MSVKCPHMSTKCPLSSFGLWTRSLTVVAQEKRSCALYSVIKHQSQLRLGHCCTCTASCRACPPMVQVVPVIVIPITWKSNHELQQYKDMSIIISTPSDQPIGFNIAVDSSPCPCSGLDLSSDFSPLGLYLPQVGLQLWTTVSPGVHLLQHRLIHSHSHFKVHLFQYGLIHGPWRSTCFSVALPTATVPSEVNQLQYGLIPGHSPARAVPALWWAYLWPHTLRSSSMTSCTTMSYPQPQMLQVCGVVLGPQSLQRHTCCGTDITMATDTPRYTCSGMDLFMATGALGCPAPM